MKQRILLIESKKALHRSLASRLKEADFEVTITSDGRDVLNLLVSIQPHLVIVSEDPHILNMWDTCSLIRENSSIPIILLGSSQNEHAFLKALTYGADFYMQVPFSSQELIARIKSLIRRYCKKSSLNTIVDSYNS